MRSTLLLKRGLGLTRSSTLPRSSTTLPRFPVRSFATEPPKPRPQFKSSGAPVYKPPPRLDANGRPSRPAWLSIVLTSQMVIGGIVLITIGYWIGINQVPKPPKPTTSMEGLKPSKIAIEEQERNQPSYGSLEDYKALIGELRLRWRSKGKEDKVSTDKEDLETHGISDWSYHEAKRPTVVVWVESTEEVQEVVLLARKYKVPITPYSGGTSLEGHFSSVSRLCLLSSPSLPCLPPLPSLPCLSFLSFLIKISKRM